jgi:proliferating cell nuclear antigen
MDIDTDTLGIPDTEYDVCVSMPSADFARIVRDLSALGESVKIDVSKDGVRFSAEGEAANGNILVKQSENARRRFKQVGKVKEKEKGKKSKVKKEEGGEDEEEEEPESEDEEGESSKKKKKKTKVKKEEGGSDVEMVDDDDDDDDDDEAKPDEDADEDEDSDQTKKRKKAPSKVRVCFGRWSYSCFNPLVFVSRPLKGPPNAPKRLTMMTRTRM